MPREEPTHRALTGEYENADLAALGKACSDLSFELRALKQPQRSAEERLAIVDRAAELLARAAGVLTPHDRMPGEPEWTLHKSEFATLESAYGDWALQLICVDRHRAIRRAFNYVFRSEDEWRKRSSHLFPSDVLYNDENMRAALRKLDELRRARSR